MEPILADLLARAGAARRRLLIGGAVALGVIALVVAVALSATTASGGTVRVAVQPVRSSPVPTPSALLVQVSGAVRRPGLVAVPDGSRAVDAIAAAGGPTAAADESGVNLAARVVDGQQLVVPARRAAPPAGPAASTAGGPVSLSAASADQLQTLPRIGPAMAARIIAWRGAHGPFHSVNDLLQVGGIGPKTLAGLQGLVTP
ncbi:MAG TPA: ComEA family DNA-binding protein [Amnibacterium sp.]|nr:ComEA family DNA-binding protein [Amnibacterium sp.]